MAVAQLLVVGVDFGADGLRPPEIEGRTSDRIDPSECQEGRIDRRIAVGGDRQQVVENRMRRIARQVEIGVVRQVDDRRPVGGRLIGDVDGVVLRQAVDYLRSHSAGESRIAVGRMQCQGERLRVGLVCLVNAILPPVGAAVQAVPVVIHGQAHRIAVEDEPPVTDAVGIPPDRRTEIRRNPHVIGDIVESEHHVAQRSRAVGHHDRYDPAAEIGDANLHSRGVGQRVEVGRPAVHLGAEPFAVEPRQTFIARSAAAGRNHGRGTEGRQPAK